MNRGSATEASAIRLVNTIRTTCLQFNLYSQISAEAKQRLVNYCQNKYSVNGRAGSGCMVCTDIDRSLTATGVSLDVAACGSSAKLRALQDTVVTKTVSTVYVVCAAQNYLCSTQLEESSNSSIFASFRDSVDTNEEINAVISAPASSRQLQAVTRIDLAGVYTITDGAVPEFTVCASETALTESCYNVTVNKFDYVGDYSFSFKFNASYWCKYAILEDNGTLPTVANLDAANANLRGNFWTAAGLSTTIVNGTQKSKLVRDKTFGLFVNCPWRRVIEAQTANTVVFKVTSKPFPMPVKGCPKQDLDINKDLEDGCTCLDDNTDLTLRVAIPQGPEGEDCLANYFTLSMLLALIALVFF